MKNFLSLAYAVVLTLLLSNSVFAQIRRDRPSDNKNGDLLDSLRKIDDGRQDTIIYTARYIRYTNLNELQDSTHTLPIDTSLTNFQNFSAISQPYNPTVNLGGNGLAYRNMLFTPSRTIGFDPGFHSFDAYLLTQDSIRYFRARAPFTELYYANGSSREQYFKATHSQNITKNWNIGANYFRNGSEGYYRNQQVGHLHASVFTWYQSKSKRYNLIANGLFNTIKADENGSVLNDSIFTSQGELGANSEIVRLNESGDNKARQHWLYKNFFLKQFYYIGRIDSLTSDTATTSSILPTQRVSHTFSYTSNKYRFYSNQEDIYGAFPYQETLTPLVPGQISTDLVNDSTTVKNLSNELMYSFYLRGKSLKFIKNELKLDVGIQHDLFWYHQMGYDAKFQNITLKARPGYRFSNRVFIEGDLQQIFQGRNAGDFFYEARANFLLSNSVGRIVLGAYSQNKSPEQLFERLSYNFHNWFNNFERTKVNNLNFTYFNDKLKAEIRADYYLMSNYLYLQGSSASSNETISDQFNGVSYPIVEGSATANRDIVFPNVVTPVQFGPNINLLRITLKKNFKFGKFNFENYTVYQKTDFQDILRTPEFYTYNSFYYGNRYFKVLYADIGFDIRYNSAFYAPSYAINISQFYNGPLVKFSNYPVMNVWLRANLKRASLFLKYDYVNQGLFSKGYYTVNRYPMPDALLKFGVSWKFYD